MGYSQAILVCPDPAGHDRQLLLRIPLARRSIFIGRYIIPEQSRDLFRSLEDYRYISLALGAAAALMVGAFLIYKLSRLLRLSRNADEVLKKSIDGLLGDNFYSSLALFEAKAWHYALFMRKGNSLDFKGEQHFGYARNGGNAPNQLGFIIAIRFELPLMHMLLHFIWSPTAAIVASALSGWACYIWWRIIARLYIVLYRWIRTRY